MAVRGLGCPVRIRVTAGQCGDAPQATDLISLDVRSAFVSLDCVAGASLGASDPLVRRSTQSYGAGAAGSGRRATTTPLANSASRSAGSKPSSVSSSSDCSPSSGERPISFTRP